MPRPKERSVKAPILKKTTVLFPSKSYYSMTNLAAMVSGHSSSGTLEHSAHFMQPYKPADSLLPRNTWPRNKLFCLPERPDGISSNQHHYKYCCVLKRSFADTDWKIQGCRKGARSLLYKDNFLPIQKNSNKSVHSFLVIEEVRGQLHTVIRKGLKTQKQINTKVLKIVNNWRIGSLESFSHPIQCLNNLFHIMDTHTPSGN